MPIGRPKGVNQGGLRTPENPHPQRAVANQAETRIPCTIGSNQSVSIRNRQVGDGACPSPFYRLSGRPPSQNMVFAPGQKSDYHSATLLWTGYMSALGGFGLGPARHFIHNDYFLILEDTP